MGIIIIDEEKLQEEATRRFMEYAFRIGEIKTTGTDIDKILPPVSRFGGGNRSEKKERVIERLKAYPEQTEALKKACTDYLDHTGMKSAWHEKGNIRKENVLAALNLIDPAKAKEYEQKANTVREGQKQSVQQRRGIISQAKRRTISVISDVGAEYQYKIPAVFYSGSMVKYTREYL